MDSVDLQVLKSSADWLEQGHRVVLATVVETWGSSPRPAGAMLAIRDDGQVAGSVSGGCVEDDLIDRIRNHQLAGDKPELTVYGISKEQAARFGLPCGGPAANRARAVARCRVAQSSCSRASRTASWWRAQLDVRDRRGRAHRGQPCADSMSFDGKRLQHHTRSALAAAVIGAGQLSRYLAQMAMALDYTRHRVRPARGVCRQLGSCRARSWTAACRTMSSPQLDLDATARWWRVTHDPKLDDLALIEALKSAAFYVGALGSRLEHRQAQAAPGRVRSVAGGARSPARSGGAAHRQQDPARDRRRDPGGDDRGAPRRGPRYGRHQGEQGGPASRRGRCASATARA